MGGVKNVKEPSVDLDAGVGRPKNQRGRQQGENRPVHRMAADHKSQRVAGTAPHSRQIAQAVAKRGRQAVPASGIPGTEEKRRYQHGRPPWAGWRPAF